MSEPGKWSVVFGEKGLYTSYTLVEAMASHRPYRPELGIERALAEVEAQRGLLFDPEVVDACLRLFREQRYSLVTPSCA